MALIMGNRFNRRFAVEKRRRQVVELYLQGTAQGAIAEQLGISQSTVSDDLKAVRKLWRESSIRDFDELRSMELEKIDLIEREAWAAWKRSQKPAQSATVTGEGAAERRRKSMKNQVGDPRFLILISQCIGQRRSLLGLDVLPAAAPIEESFDANLTPELRRERVVALITAIRERDRDRAAGTDAASGQPGHVRHANEPGNMDTGPAPDPA